MVTIWLSPEWELVYLLHFLLSCPDYQEAADRVKRTRSKQVGAGLNPPLRPTSNLQPLNLPVLALYGAFFGGGLAGLFTAGLGLGARLAIRGGIRSSEWSTRPIRTGSQQLIGVGYPKSTVSSITKRWPRSRAFMRP